MKNFFKGMKNIAQKYNLELLVLFGSRAKGTQKKNSDYDLAFLASHNFSTEEEMKLFDEIISWLNDEKVDLINLRKSNKLYLINNVFQTGKIIYEKYKGLFTRKKWDAWLDYQDFKKYYKWREELTKKGLKRMISENG